MNELKYIPRDLVILLMILIEDVALQNTYYKLAEQQAKLNGVKTIGLEFAKDESDRFVLDWYLRSGYKPFDKKSNLLIKELKD